MVCTQAGALGCEGTVSGWGLQAPVTEPAWCYVELGIWGGPNPVTEPWAVSASGCWDPESKQRELRHEKNWGSSTCRDVSVNSEVCKERWQLWVPVSMSLKMRESRLHIRQTWALNLPQQDCPHCWDRSWETRRGLEACGFRRLCLSWLTLQTLILLLV